MRAERANREVFGYVEYVSNVTALQLRICTFSKHRGELQLSQKVSIISKDSHCRVAHLLPTLMDNVLNFQQEL